MEAESHRVHLHLETIERDAIPILTALQDTREYPVASFAEWVIELARTFATLQVDLEQANATLLGRYVLLLVC
jgi:mannitol-1-phosphate/altronate dehydrogenase